MQTLRVVALKPNGPAHKKAVNRRRDGPQGYQDIWEMHTEFFVDAQKKYEETRVTVVPESIENF